MKFLVDRGLKICRKFRKFAKFSGCAARAGPWWLNQGARRARGVGEARRARAGGRQLELLR